MSNALTKDEKKVLRNMYINSNSCFVCFNMVKMEGNGFCLTMVPAINDVYKDNEELRKDALRRHNGFFNTHAVFIPLIAGLCYAMEKEKKNSAVDAEVIDSIKAALMGPTAAIGDSFFYNCVRVIAAGIGIGIASSGNPLGVILFILLYGGSQMIIRWELLVLGYQTGGNFIKRLFENGLIDILTKCSSIVGIGMVGALVAQLVNVPLNLVINVSGAEVNFGEILDSIFPGILSIALVFGMVGLLKKGMSPSALIILLMVVSIALAFIGVF